MSNEAPKSEDPYGGFNEYDHAYDLENVYNDAEFMRAAQRTSHSRRPELDKAKEAGRKEQQMNKLRRDASLPDNPDLFFLAQFASACAHMSNNLLNEALGIYEIIMKEEQFKNAQRLKVNIGNIYFRKRDFAQAVNTRILGNIGVALVKLGRYEDAMAAFEECLETSGGDYGAALNLILAAYCLEDTDKMREAFQRLVDIPTMISTSDDTESDILVVLTNSDLFETMGRTSFAEGYAWCVTSIKQSVYATLATELEMNKAVDMLKQGQLDNATETLNAFIKEALQVEPSCIQAIYNIGLVSRKIDDWESAKNSFYKLNNMLINNVQVLTQLALLYEENKEYEQARDFYNQASTLAPTDPAIQSKLANLYDIEGNKSDAFVWNVEETILSMLSFLKKLFTISKKQQSWSLKFLVQLCSDLRMPEKSEYEEKLKKLERMNLLRLQRESDSSQNRRAALHSGSIPSTSRSLSSNTRQESRTTSANQNRALLDTDEPYRISKRDLSSADFSYNDMLAPEPQRPKTGINETADPFDMRDFVADDLLPE
ncbi:hypothetical protein M3Y94_00559000 [Aphelenchoides besseyi]|nr:hypothetical protein M3Y94_00559000 [Aphelenchoides besseyi]